MDHDSFDRLVRVLGTAGSRRAVLASLLGAGSLGAIAEVWGKGKDRKKQRRNNRDNGKGKNANRKRGKDRARTQPPAPANELPAGDAVAAEAADCFSLGPGSNLNKCNFNDQDFAGLDLYSSSMRETKFRGANLCGADLSSSQLKDADFRGLSASNPTNLTRADLSSSGCTGTKFDANTILCQTRTCNGATNNRNCPNGQICCDAGDCEERVCQTAACQSPACVYTDQPDGQPGNQCNTQCCDGECCGENQKCCGGNCIANDACCTNNEEGCGNDQKCCGGQCIAANRCCANGVADTCAGESKCCDGICIPEEDCCPVCLAGETCLNDACCPNNLVCGGNCLPRRCENPLDCQICDPEQGMCINACGPTEECCAQPEPTPNICRLASGQLCTSDDQCCQSEFNNLFVRSICTDEFSFEKICCMVEGSFCSRNTDCCSGICDEDDHECE